MTAAPLSYQTAAIERHTALLRRGHASLEASIPGFGKTYVAAFVAKRLGLRLAVLCPKSVIGHWIQAAKDCDVECIFVTNYEQAKLTKFKFGNWAIKNRAYKWELPEDHLLIFDEAHRCADRKTQNAKLMIAARRNRCRTLAMSATAAQDPLDLYAIGYLIGLHSGEDFLYWCFSLGVVKGRFAFEFRGGKPALLRLNSMLFPSRGHRATYDDLPGFPEHFTEAVSVTVENPSEVDEIYERVSELEELEAGAQEAVVQRLRARQLAELKKVPALVEMTKDAVAEGMSVIIFVNFLDTLAELADKFPDAAVIQGGQSESLRDLQIESFQSDYSRIILCQIRSGGVGISLHDTHGDHPRLALISPPDGARDLIQALGRNRRAGQKTPAYRKIVFAADTVEEKVRRGVERKVDAIETINDRDLDPLYSGECDTYVTPNTVVTVPEISQSFES